MKRCFAKGHDTSTSFVGNVVKLKCELGIIQIFGGRVTYEQSQSACNEHDIWCLQFTVFLNVLS